MESASNPSLEMFSSWIERAVIGKGLCPFARAVVRQGMLSLVECQASDEADAAQSVVFEAAQLANGPEGTTVIVVFTGGLEDFDAFLEVVEIVEDVAARMGLSASVQFAHFHPRYRFQGTVADDPTNYTNRSPLPAIHLLQVDDVAAAIDAYPDTLAIPENNVQMLSGMCKEELRRLQYGDCTSD